MAKTNKIADKVTKVSEIFTVSMYDNGFMFEISGRDKKDEYKTVKLIVPTVEELIELVKEATAMEKEG